MNTNAMEHKASIWAYVQKNLDAILKPPRAFIRYPFIDPGSVYDGNVWDWDTYWSVHGLLSMLDALDGSTQARVLEHARGNVLNFLDHQLEDGYIPMMIEVAQWPEPYLNMRRKEGVLLNMHKPFLCGQICSISDAMGDFGWALAHMDALERYFACYDANYLHARTGLYVWHDDIMIGMDNDPATFGRPPCSTANIFLNSFMVEELRCMARLLRRAGDPKRADAYMAKRDRLIEAIQAECWDPRDGFFYSADVDIHTRPYDWFHQGLGVFWKTLPIKIRVWSGFIPLWAGFATKAQAARLVTHWRDEATFGSPYGVTTLAKDEKMFNLSPTINPSNWLGPVWLVANYVVFRGLLRYGYPDDARCLCERSLALLGNDLAQSGMLHEYYDPFTGEPILNGGFINWNMLALTMARDLEAAGAAG